MGVGPVGGGQVQFNAPAATGLDLLDAPALQAFFSAVTPGSKAVLPAGLWILNATVQYPADLTIDGASKDGLYGTRLKMADGANLDAVLASSQWFSASATPAAAEPTNISNLYIDCNQANQASGLGIGLVTMNYGSRIHRVAVQRARTDGFRASGLTKAGVEITNSMPAIRFTECDAANFLTTGIRVLEAGATAHVIDGWIKDCFIDGAGVGESAINIDVTAGWQIHGNHGFNVTKSMCKCSRGFRAKVQGNYFEGFGSSAAAGTYCGVDFEATGLSNGASVHVTGNNIHAGTATLTAGTVLYGVAVQVATAATTAVVEVSGNTIQGRTHTTPTTGLLIHQQTDAAGITDAEEANIILGWDVPILIGGNTSIRLKSSGGGQQRALATTFSATPIVNPAKVEGASGLYIMTLTANITSLTTNQAGRDGQKMTFLLTQGGVGSFTVAWSASFVNPPTLRTAAGAVDSVSYIYSAALAKWVYSS